MGFAEGFAQGFNMVDSALQRRNMQMLEEDKIKRDDQRYQDQLKREEQKLEIEKDRWDKTYTMNDAHYKASAKNNDERIALDKSKLTGDQRHQLQQEKNEQARIGLSSLVTKSNIARDKSVIDAADLERKYLIEQKDRESAGIRAQNLFNTDAKTGITTLSLTPGNEESDLKDIQTAFGVNVSKISSDLSGFKGNIAHIKTALANPAYFQQNKQSVLKAFNDIEDYDINKGLGEYDGTNPEFKGGKVVKKEITDIFPSPDGGGLVFNVKTYIEKNGKTYTDEGPMTQFRSSNPADQNIRVIPIQDIVKRVDGYDTLGKVLDINPEFSRAVTSVGKRIKPKVDDKNLKDNYVEVKNKDAIGNEVSAKYNPETGETLSIDPKGNVQRGVVSQATMSDSDEAAFNKLKKEQPGVYEGLKKKYPEASDDAIKRAMLMQ